MIIDDTALVYLGLLGLIAGGIWLVNYIEAREFDSWRRRRRRDDP